MNLSPSVVVILSIAISLLVILGLVMMTKVTKARLGNRVSAVAMFLAVLLTVVRFNFAALVPIIICILIGSVVGIWLSRTVKMIQMPQLVGLLNGIGGLASMLVGAVVMSGATIAYDLSALEHLTFGNITSMLAILIGALTFTGSLVAAAKLHGVFPGRPIVIPRHRSALMGAATIMAVCLVWSAIVGADVLIGSSAIVWIIIAILSAGLFGHLFAIRVGGADMPITISLLNSLSGVAGGIAGMALGDPLLVIVGGIVGASGLFLTQIMCRAMNRSLMNILFPKDTPAPVAQKKQAEPVKAEKPQAAAPSLGTIVQSAKRVIIVPGYGMALAQAQQQVAALANALRGRGADVKFAIHPVAGRMPGHMNVLLAEANVDYEELYEMERINPEFAATDLVIVIGANDVVNPAAREAEGTPIYGMPVLLADQAKHIIFCNYDLKPGYAGVENPLYSNKEKVTMLLGDAKESIAKIDKALNESLESAPEEAPKAADPSFASVLQTAKRVIIVPGYGMALAQAQQQVAALANALRGRGADVKFAIHPVAGRMPGHMNVLLAEANVDYEELYEMDRINPEFAATDLVIVIGANDVVNPAAREAEGTPIYGMPVLLADQAKHIIFCNYDLKPGYAGVENPLYSNKEKVTMLLGDAKESIAKIDKALNEIVAEAPMSSNSGTELSLSALLNDLQRVIIVPGYGMALAQAQQQVAMLAQSLRKKGADVRFAIHPVAGRMPGHMNVLLAEANVDYDELYEMERINPDFASTDLVIVVGANDVVNPAAREAEGTPIYGMPILLADQAKRIIFCNYDLKPGYAGVENPLYSNKEKVLMLLGDAKESIAKIQAELA
ncbi:NAD(P)(+) transhydrogenase (Re/Si-specific) subunit beta [Porphyromonas canoris]|uniref:proton-translocating NAD(P)(+) transhydrogenase n=1 Tax=Porphyromonas canoris TaxID=36875 RepID=A0ABR4XP56_9PORP|nr:NAD(P)(+) transhydrogenase (Re/Si-specific) subunit beta [Porphyromonas canoris]KGN93303.1 hypothetical protein HQ43_01255 [Porphyromonas canoris]